MEPHVLHTAVVGLLQDFLRHFRDLIQVPRIRENYHRFPKIRENQVPRIREIGSLQIHIGCLTFSLKKPVYYVTQWCVYKKKHN